jgi:hypothetical protein
MRKNLPLSREGFSLSTTHGLVWLADPANETRPRRWLPRWEDEGLKQVCAGLFIRPDQFQQITNRKNAGETKLFAQDQQVFILWRILLCGTRSDPKLS